MLDDFFDLLYTVAVSVLLLLFINAALSGGIDQSNKKALSNFKDFKKESSALANLRVAMNSGLDLETIDIEEKISKSKILAGKTITDCNDYTYKLDCLSDPVRVRAGQCLWDEEDNDCWFI